MMEQPAGRALVQETIDEALSFRRAMTAVKKQVKNSWWFEVWQPDAMAKQPIGEQPHWVLKPTAKWHGFEDLAENDVIVDPIKVTILTPGLTADGTMEKLGIPGNGRGSFPVVPADRDREDGPLFLPGALLHGHHQGQVEHARYGTHQLQGSVRRQRAAQPRAAGAGGSASGGLCQDGPQGPLRGDPRVYRDDKVPKAQKDMYTTLPEIALRPADAYEQLVRGRTESVEIDNLMGRTMAVMVVPYPPGIPVIMPGERLTSATKSIQDYLLYAREFDTKFPGFETDIHGLRFEPKAGGRRYLVDCVK